MDLHISQDSVLWTPDDITVKAAVKEFLAAEPGWKAYALTRDPALLETGSKEEIPGGSRQLDLYQGLHAIALHKQAHALYDKGQKAKQQGNRTAAGKYLWEARAVSQGARRVAAGIEIHPGAQIGTNFFIDHGTGEVIGETAIIGNNVAMYHDVTLGATSHKQAEINQYGIARRHPRIDDGVILSKGSSLLGPMHIGKRGRVQEQAALNGMITTGEHVRFGTACLVKGSLIEIGEETTIGTTAHVICDEKTGHIRIGKNVSIEDGVIISGNVTIGDNVTIHAGAQITGDVTIGEKAIVAPGITVTWDVPPGEETTGQIPGWVASLSEKGKKIAGAPVFKQVHETTASAVNGMVQVLREALGTPQAQR